MTSPAAKAIWIVLAIVLINVYRVHGAAGVRAWFASKFLNRQGTKPVTRRTRRVAQTRTASELAWKDVPA